jgi:regulator of CtrA degradation
VHEGEISTDEALAEPNRLSGTDVCLDESFANDQTLPGGLRSLMARSFHLYVRISRLEAQILRRQMH